MAVISSGSHLETIPSSMLSPWILKMTGDWRPMELSFPSLWGFQCCVDGVLLATCYKQTRAISWKKKTPSCVLADRVLAQHHIMRNNLLHGVLCSPVDTRDRHPSKILLGWWELSLSLELYFCTSVTRHNGPYIAQSTDVDITTYEMLSRCGAGGHLTAFLPHSF